MKKMALMFIFPILLASCANLNTDTAQDALRKQISELQNQNAWLLAENNALKTELQERWQKILCKDEPEWTPIITSLSSESWSINTTITINWCNFEWFEGDKLAWIENENWAKWILYSESWSTAKQMKVTIKPALCLRDTSYSGEICDAYLNLVPWKYKIYVNPWGKMSNMIEFTIKGIDNL